MKKLNRRTFLNKTLSTAALSVPVLQTTSDRGIIQNETSFTVLFQGDSITDGNRGRSEDPNHILGHGYAFTIASTLAADYPERNLKFINKGISGDKIGDLFSRWSRDTVAIRPNLVSILIGVNDVLQSINNNFPFPVRDFEVRYEQLIIQTKKDLPDVVIVVGEPFILPVGMVAKDKKRWNEMITLVQSSIRKLSKSYELILIPYQSTFEEACTKASPDYWIWDGIHPTYAGHGLMARVWLEVVGETHERLSP
jgi:lysophospholipase L1-like esterase